MLNANYFNLGPFPSFTRVVVGVSGGPDSVALADILRRKGYAIILAHLNHSLRGKESDADAAYVRELALRWKVPFVIAKVRIPPGGNLESQARKIRYQFLEKVRKAKKAKFIAVAHHLDDQIETLLMHLRRGAGLRGLVGMRPKQDRILRPLLFVTKKDLLLYLKKQKLPYRVDRTNFNLNFERNYLRYLLIPELKKKWKSLETDLLNLSAKAARTIRSIETKARRWSARYFKKDAFDRSAFLVLPEDVQSEVLFNLLGRQDVYEKNIRELKALIQKGAAGKKKEINGLLFTMKYDKVAIQPAGKNPPISAKLKLGHRSQIWGKWRIIYRGKKILFVRSWKPGDRLQPAGMRGSKKLQDLFTDLKIPKAERPYFPVIVDHSDEVLAVGDRRVSVKGVELKENLKVSRIRAYQN